MITKETLDSHKDILNEGVFGKLQLFIATPPTSTGYCMKARSYIQTVLSLEELQSLTSYGYSYSFIYSSDQFPYYARYGQPCWGPLGGLKPGQTNLYIWFPTLTTLKMDTIIPANPFYTFFEDVLKGMFKPNVDREKMKEFVGKFGYVFAPSVLEAYPSPIIAGFMIWSRYQMPLTDASALQTVATRIFMKTYEGKGTFASTGGAFFGPSLVASNWATVRNFVNGTFNEHIMKLPSFAEDPDWSCWDSPVYNLFTDHDIIGEGKYITERAQDITWDPWVERNTAIKLYYGRNNGTSEPKNSGEVLKDLRKLLGPKFASIPYDEALQKIRDYMRERLNNYEQAA